MVTGFGAEGGTRTPTPLRAHDPESRGGLYSAPQLFCALRSISLISLSLQALALHGTKFARVPNGTGVAPVQGVIGRKRAQEDRGLRATDFSTSARAPSAMPAVRMGRIIANSFDVITLIG